MPFVSTLAFLLLLLLLSSAPAWQAGGEWSVPHRPPMFALPAMRDPTPRQLQDMRIALASVAVPTPNTNNTSTHEQGAALLRYAWSACVLFQSFRRTTQIANVDYLLVTRQPSEDMKKLALWCNMTLVEREPLISHDAISDEALRQLTDDTNALSGIGLMDFDFLWPWEFEEYDRILIVDGDMLAMGRSMDHLFVSPHDLLFTNGLVSPVNGGFQLVRPSRSTLAQMWRLITAPGAFSPETGWYGMGLPEGRTYGAATLQGFLTYFAHRVCRSSLELPRALYNCQFDPEIEALNLDCTQLYLAHYTACPKPMRIRTQQFAGAGIASRHLCACAFFQYKAFQLHLLHAMRPSDIAHIAEPVVVR